MCLLAASIPVYCCPLENRALPLFEMTASLHCSEYSSIPIWEAISLAFSSKIDLLIGKLVLCAHLNCRNCKVSICSGCIVRICNLSEVPSPCPSIFWRAWTSVCQAPSQFGSSRAGGDPLPQESSLSLPLVCGHSLTASMNTYKHWTIDTTWHDPGKL